MVKAIFVDGRRINTLTIKGVEHLHSLLSKNYSLLKDIDPVKPKGVKDRGLLASAVDRQHVGSGDWYKYGNCFRNCATLVFGVTKNHSFNNGNKRTGLLCLIKHLYINGYVLKSISHKEIYRFIIAIADNNLLLFSNENKNYKRYIKREKLQKLQKLGADQKLNFIAFWIKHNSVSKKYGIKNKVKLNRLKSILHNKGLQIEQKGNKIKVYKEEDVKLFGFKIRKKRDNEREYSIGNSKTEIEASVLKRLRKDFELTLSDGVDNVSFYDDDSFFDEEIKAYKKIIYRLSKV